MRDMTLPSYAALGLIGGLLGTILMDVVMIVTFISVGERADLFFSMVGEKLGGGVLTGIAVHNVIGMTGGLIFAVLVARIPAIRIESMRKGVILGLAAGAFTIPAGCIPMAIWLGEPIIDVLAFSILPHLVWGTVLGAVLARGVLHRDSP